MAEGSLQSLCRLLIEGLNHDALFGSVVAASDVFSILNDFPAVFQLDDPANATSL